jgi:hypothetical protein
LGGFGSGRWGGYTPKTVVEDCLVLDIGTLTREGALSASPGEDEGFQLLEWIDVQTDAQKNAVSFRQERADESGLALRLRYRVGGEKVDLRIRLQTMPTPFDGFRWWFSCPLMMDSLFARPCRRRTAKLYLPPGSKYFGCRHCYDLAYTSSQSSRKLTLFDRLIAANAGCSAQELQRFTINAGKRNRLMKRWATRTRVRPPSPDVLLDSAFLSVFGKGGTQAV